MCQKIVIESRAGIGDLIHMLPVMQNLKLEYPQCHIHLICSQEGLAKLLQKSKLIDNYSSFGSKKEYGIIKTFFCILKLREEKFDLGIIDPIANQKRWKKIMKLWGCSKVIETNIGHNKQNIEGQLALKGFAVLEAMGIPIRETVAKLNLSEVHIENSEKFDFIGRGQRKTIGICVREGLSARGLPYNEDHEDEVSIKILPMSIMVELANKLTKENFNVVFLGGETDSKIMEDYEEQIEDKANCVNLVGKLTLEETLFGMQKCALIVGGDFGLIHLADAAAVPTVVYYASTDPKIVGPFSDKVTRISAGLDCQYCFHRKKSVLCKSKECIRAINSELLYDETMLAMEKIRKEGM